MTLLNIAGYSWLNGAFIMIGIFTLVIIDLVGFVLKMMNDKYKKTTKSP
jgi:hypothetical protein